MVAVLRDAGLQPIDYDPFAGGDLQRVVPTTEPQREVWLADRLGRDASLAFNESVSLHFRGALDADALADALQALVDRHDSLRANVGPDGDTLCVRAAMPLALQRIDVSGLGVAERDAERDARLRAAVDTPFALESDALLRAELLRLAPDEHLLILTAHHIVCDGWSWWVLVRELAALYAARRGADAELLAPADGFADYALAEAMHPGGPSFAADQRYWLARFADGAPVLDLPTDRPRPARRSFASAREDVVLDAALVSALRRVGARRGASLFATLLGGFAATLARIAAQSQVVVGIPAAGQSIDGHDSLVGHCVNTLPLAFDLDMAQPATRVVDAAQQLLLDALEHQRYTFGTLLKQLRIPRDPARLPLISVLFNIDQALDQASAAFPGLELDFACNARSHENFELFVNAVQAHGELRLECQYNRDLFDAATVRRWLHAYGALLRALTEHGDDALGALPLVDADARARLDALQPAATPFDRAAFAHELFERQCDRAPQRVALRHRDETLSYRELDARANRIAHLLRARGVHPGALVGLALDRGPDMLAALLGILKAGAGYVPLDPGYPPERLAYMAGDAGLAALVTQARHAAHFDLRGRPVLALDRLADELAAQPDTRPDRDADASPETVAYVIYTSGSTGRPKGVQVPHRAVVNFLGAMREEPGLSQDDVLVAVTTLSFDIAVLELLLPLGVGAQTVIADRDTAIDGVALARLLAATGATVMQATPATWRMLIDTGWTGAREFRALCGGEPLPPDLAASLLSRCAQLWNLYGPTETTVWSTCARIVPGAGGRAPDIHIGRPIANTQVWIVDAQGALCVEGVPGEIWIGGDGVTLGYLYRPELTESRFVADRFSAPAGEGTRRWLYRTGDRGRWRADGVLEHQGRLDFQVKIRGFRIELGEIENVLLGHADVTQAVAIAREDRPGDVRLVAYVARRAGSDTDAAALATHLRGTLPDYMIPQHIVALDVIPLLPNGKVDRSALPAPDVAGHAAQDRVAPRNARERAIADAMAQVLGQPDVGVHDDFFAIGGHSLLAAQLTTRLNRDLGAALSLRSLFDGPTVAKLAAMIGDDAAALPPRAPIRRRADQSRAPLSLVQDRLRLIETFNPGTLSYNTPSAHRLKGPLDPALLDEAVRRLAQRQTVLRTTIAIENDEPVQVIHDEIDTGLGRVIDLSQLPVERREAELARRMRALVETPFADLSRAPLFCARLYKLADDEHALFFMPHHIVWDGWSFDLMYADLAELYAALVDGRDANLPELPVTYGDYAAWHRDWVQGPEYAQQLAFWRERLGGENSEGGRPEALPTDKPRKRGMSGSSRSCAVTVPGALTDALQRASRGIDVTLFVTLLSAYYVILGQRAGRRDMVIGTPVRGRNSAEVEGLMGYFTNLLPLRVELEPDASFAELARAVRGVVLDSFAAPDIRLEDLTRELSLKSEGGGTMLYQALFSFQDIRHRGARWGNVDHSRIEVFQPGATEDLGLWFVEDADGMTGGMIYNADILEDATIRGLRARYLHLLDEIARDPSRSVAEMADACERHAAAMPDVDDEVADDTHLPTTDQEPSMSATPSNAADPRERYLLAMWSELFGTEVQTGDNFFDLGGNSMLAVQMAERVARDTGFKIKLMRLAVQSLGELAADLPADAGTKTTREKGGGFMRNVKRLFGAGESARA
jgi:amino acid adenylation domain-containing protein